MQPYIFRSPSRPGTVVLKVKSFSIAEYSSDQRQPTKPHAEQSRLSGPKPSETHSLLSFSVLKKASMRHNQPVGITPSGQTFIRQTQPTGRGDSFGTNICSPQNTLAALGRTKLEVGLNTQKPAFHEYVGYKIQGRAKERASRNQPRRTSYRQACEWRTPDTNALRGGDSHKEADLFPSDASTTGPSSAAPALAA